MIGDQSGDGGSDSMTPASDPRTHIPEPPDLYEDQLVDATRPLSPFQEELILSACPRGSRIVEARFAREDRLPCPVRVHVASPESAVRQLILRMDRHIDGVAIEATLLPVLARLGLPVPTVLAGPSYDPARPGLGALSVLSVLPGQDLLSWAWNAPAADLATATRLVLDSVERLHHLTGALNHDPVADLLPRATVGDELDGVIARGGPWFDEPVFAQAIEALRPIVAAIDTPLAFSSGDYNPGNFLWDGENVIGFIDFAWACFEDPHIGFAKYWLYDWFPLNKAGLIERYLETQRLTQADFAPRLAVRCLWTLQREIPVADVDGATDYTHYRDRVLGFLRHALQELG